METVLITGGAGFIGSSTVRQLLETTDAIVINVDKLTYAGNQDNLAGIEDSPRYRFVQADICDERTLSALLARHQPEAVMHLAAESHVDRSIDGPAEFIRTNLFGTGAMLGASLDHWRSLPSGRRERFRFLHASTDEVYGDLPPADPACTEAVGYRPSSPYAATKAGADHLVRAWHRTYGLPVVITNGSNTYGPRQFPEKLIPHMILNALAGKPLPLYGNGQQVRDWLYVEDHARGLITALCSGRIGETYNLSGGNSLRNIEVVREICRLLEDEFGVTSGTGALSDLITFVPDRPGHDARYAIDASKIRDETGWQPGETFETGIRKTISWYLQNRSWWERVLSGSYRLERIGTGIAGNEA